VDPETAAAVFDMVDPKKTVVNIITKSGGTAETIANYLALLERLGPAETVITTTRGKGDMAALARAKDYPVFPIPENVGGRFSVLSPVGLLPSALCGIDIRALRAGADYMKSFCLEEDFDQNPALISAAVQYLLDTQKGKTIQVIFPYADGLSALGDWFCQLWAESLGKKYDRDGEIVYVGQTPVRAIGTIDQHSQIQLYNHGPNNKSVTFLEPLRYRTSIKLSDALSGYAAAAFLSGKTMNALIQAEKQGTEQALTASKRPNSTIKIPEINAFTLGQLFFLFEFQTAVAGELYNVNAFDQPGVEDGKKITARLMGKKG
jgi:glucose-6-phosphate isomerase